MDSPDQNVKGIPVTSTSFENSTLTVKVSNVAIEYKGILEGDSIIRGNFKQRGQSFLMNLSKKAIEKEIIVRSQEPTKPYGYVSQNITFKNKKEGITLAGTLTLPKKEGYFPAVILISGSGAQNRDEAILGHKPFLILSDHLTKKGIAVLRFDDRGTALSTGDFNTATSFNFSNDVAAGIEYLKSRKEINNNKIGLIGHSEGGLIAPMIAARSNDVAFIVLMAAPGISGDEILLLQQKLIGKASGMSDEDLKKNEKTNKKIYEIVNKSTSLVQLKTDLNRHILQTLKDSQNTKLPEGISENDYAESQVNLMTIPWMRFFLKYDPSSALKKVKCPVLAINGKKDLQVPPAENLNAIKKALEKGGNKKVTIKELPQLNHLFQECETGSPSEYATIEQTISPSALTEIATWVINQVK